MDRRELGTFQKAYQEGYQQGFRDGQQLFKDQMMNKMKENNLMMKEITSIKIKESRIHR